MDGDITRSTFDAASGFTAVRQQQGRVQLDADWNEQADLALYRDEAEAADVIGRCGGPLDAAAFGIVFDLDDLDRWDDSHPTVTPGDGAPLVEAASESEVA